MESWKSSKKLNLTWILFWPGKPSSSRRLRTCF
jgi:hypothetical protein